MKIHALASLPHYDEHVLAVWEHLPSGLKGEHHTGRFARLGRHIPADDLVMIAGFYDIDRARGRRVIYIEHGAGQFYYQENGRPHPAYHGSEHPDNVIAYIAPRQEVADAWERPAFAAGSPVCDPYPLVTGNDQPVVVITFHWDCKLLPETRSALDHYIDILGPLTRRLAADGFRVFGHHHPRDTRLPTVWKNLGVPLATVRQVRSVADLLIVDNSSLAYEMLYLNRCVVSLNAPWYRRDVSHGLRFWEAVPGPGVDDPHQLMDGIRFDELLDDSALRPMSHLPAVAAYDRALNDGNDGLRAAAWVTAFAAGL